MGLMKVTFYGVSVSPEGKTHVHKKHFFKGHPETLFFYVFVACFLGKTLSKSSTIIELTIVDFCTIHALDS